MILNLFWRILRKKMFLSFMNYFAIQCFPDTYNLVREGPNIDPYVTDLMVRAKKILGHEGRCDQGHLIIKVIKNIKGFMVIMFIRVILIIKVIGLIMMLQWMLLSLFNWLLLMISYSLIESFAPVWMIDNAINSALAVATWDSRHL